MDLPLVSIIVLTYNNFSRISETLCSVLCQDYPNFELIISDDHSKSFPHNTIEDIISKKRTVRLTDYKVIINDTNLGTVKNLNRSLRECKGEYIFCFGANDMFFDEHSVKKVIDIFINTNCDVVFTSRAVYHNDKLYEILPHVSDWPKIQKMESRISQYTSFILSEHYDVFIGVNLVYRRKTIESHNYFDENYVLMEDLPMIEKMIWDDNVVLYPSIITMLYDGVSGVSAKGKINPLLAKDIAHYNQFGKLAHYDALNKKAKKHIDFGIMRAISKNKMNYILVCLKYSPRIISYSFYLFQRRLARFSDKKTLKTIDISDYKSFLRR